MVGSLAGAWAGVHWRERMPVGPLEVIVCSYLLIAGLGMLYESFAQADHVLFAATGTLRWLLAAIINVGPLGTNFGGSRSKSFGRMRDLQKEFGGAARI